MNTARKTLALCLVVAAAVTLGSCKGLNNVSPSSPADSSADAAAALCVDTINHFRLTAGLAALARWTDEEPCANDQATNDAVSGVAHLGFQKCTEVAQNECPNWTGGTTNALSGCLTAMWNEGPGIGEEHAHYVAMSNTAYTKVACGFYTTGNGLLWSVQDFK